jgi:hypothetical protein
MNKAYALHRSSLTPLLALVVVILLPWLAEGRDCDCFLVYSSLPNVGRRILAGREIEEKELLLYTPTIFVPHELSQRTLLSNYVFGSRRDDTSIVMLSHVSLMNHSPRPNIDHFWDSYEGADPFFFPETRAANQKCFVKASENISRGGELLVTYGDNWFANRLMKETSLSLGGISKDKKDETGLAGSRFDSFSSPRVCLSDVEVRPSTRSLRHHQAGMGLFAVRSFRKDEVITVSPVLLLHASHMVDSAVRWRSLLMNYCFFRRGSPVALFPLGLSAMINHFQDFPLVPGAAETARPNVYVQWFNWTLPVSFPSTSSSSARSRLSDPLAELLFLPYAPLDLGFFAARDIEVGEELTLDYGAEWVAAYSPRYSTEQESTMFHHWMEAPEGLFPAHWLQETVEEECINSPHSCMKYEL